MNKLYKIIVISFLLLAFNLIEVRVWSQTETTFSEVKFQDVSVTDVFPIDTKNLMAVGGIFENNKRASVILKSKDGGNTWRTVFTSQKINFLYDIDFINEKKGIVVGADINNKGVILETIDGGETWTINPFQDTRLFTKSYFLNENTGWILSNSELIYRTLDGGKSWSSYQVQSEQKLVDFSFTDELNGWVIGESSKLFRTTDGGKNWYSCENKLLELLKTDDSIKVYFQSIQFFDSMFGVVSSEVLYPRIEHNEKVFDYHGVLFKTKDGGVTWELETVTNNLGISEFEQAEKGVFWVLPGYTEGFLLRLRPNRIRWDKIQIPDTEETGIPHMLRFADGKTGWILYFNGQYMTRIYSTKDGGKNWINLIKPN